MGRSNPSVKLKIPRKTTLFSKGRNRSPDFDKQIIRMEE